MEDAVSLVSMGMNRRWGCVTGHHNPKSHSCLFSLRPSPVCFLFQNSLPILATPRPLVVWMGESDCHPLSGLLAGSVGVGDTANRPQKGRWGRQGGVHCS